MQAATVNVAGNGADSVSCGATNSPCRTITQALANAVDKDTIRVGPGHYGDLNADGDFLDPEEEDSGVAGKMIVIDKLVKVFSRDGAAATVLENPTASNVTMVSIEEDGAIFGGKRRGFTLKGGGSNGTGIDISSVTTGVKAHGNVTRNLTNYFIVDGFGHDVKDNVIIGGTMVIKGSAHKVRNNIAEAGGFVTDSASTDLQIERNQSIRNLGAGFDIQGTGHLLKLNVASATSSGDGFRCQGTCSGLELVKNVARLNNGIGFSFFSGSGHVLTSNLAGGNNSSGFHFSFASATTLQLKKNEASSNAQFGFNFATFFDSANFPVMTNNAVIGNKAAGIVINGNALIQKNSIYGNDVAGANCGLDKTSGAGAVNAQKNYWGTGGAPSATEPADNTCGNTGTVDASLPSATEFRVSVVKLP